MWNWNNDDDDGGVRYAVSLPSRNFGKYIFVGNYLSIWRYLFWAIGGG